MGTHVLEAGLTYCLFDTPIGCIGLAWSELGIARLQLPEYDRMSTQRRLCRGAASMAEGAPPPPIAEAMEMLGDYFAGAKADFANVVLDLSACSVFHRRIYDATRRIGWGQTTTYGELARVAGDPDAARAVGQAMGRNPVPIIIPCHRVLASGGKAGGFSAFGGAHAKLHLLALEGLAPGEETPLLPGLLTPAAQSRA